MRTLTVNAATHSGTGPTPDRSFSDPGATRDRHPSDPGPTTSASLTLTPEAPPGRATRKARQFESEIARLRAEGHSLSAIQRALAAAGVDVSLGTVRRELKRPARAPSNPPVLSAPLPPPAASSSVSGTPLPTGPAAEIQPPPVATAPPAAVDPPSGKDLADAFFQSQSHHPLRRTKESP